MFDIHRSKPIVAEMSAFCAGLVWTSVFLAAVLFATRHVWG